MTENMSLVRQECANLVSNDCIGMTTWNTLWRERGKCYITEGNDCQYYTMCLLPLVLKQKVRKHR